MSRLPKRLQTAADEKADARAQRKAAADKTNADQKAERQASAETQAAEKRLNDHWRTVGTISCMEHALGVARNFVWFLSPNKFTERSISAGITMSAMEVQ